MCMMRYYPDINSLLKSIAYFTFSLLDHENTYLEYREKYHIITKSSGKGKTIQDI